MLFGAVAALVLALATAVYVLERDGTAPAARSLLAERPVFPVAWSRYSEDGGPTLPRVAAEGDWPNFEPWSDTEPTPRNAAALESDADEWEIGCGYGNPDGACRVWIFRGRYGRALMAAEFHFEVGLPGGGIPFADVRVFVESVDNDLAQRLRRS